MSFGKNMKLFIGRAVLDVEEDQMEIKDVCLTVEINGEAIDQLDIEDNFLVEWPLEESNLDDLIVLRVATNGNPEDLYYCKIEDTLERLKDDIGAGVRTYWLSFSNVETLGTAKTFEEIRLSTSVNRMSIAIQIAENDEEIKAALQDVNSDVSSQHSAMSGMSDKSEGRRNSFQGLHDDLKAPPLDAKKMTTEEVKALIPPHMPAWLRIDVDIKNGLVNLNHATRKYTEMDIKFLKQDAEEKMDNEFSKSSVEYDNHKREIDRQAAKSNAKASECLEIKDEVIQVRKEKFDNVRKIIDLTSKFTERDAAAAKESMQERQEIVDLNKNLRKAHNDVAVSEINGENLKVVQESEQKLNEERLVVMQKTIDIVKADYAHEQSQSQRHQDRANQDIQAFETAVQNVETYKSQCQQRYDALNEQIIENTQAQKQQSQDYSDDLQKIMSENRALKLESDKYQRDIKSHETNLVNLKNKQEAFDREWNDAIQSMNQKVADAKNDIASTLDQLEEQSVEHAEIDKKNMTIKVQIKLAQETANLFESAQFEKRIREINQMTEDHNSKTEQLQRELGEVSEAWLAYYETAISELESRLAETSNRPVLDFIEESMVEIQQYDQSIQELSKEIQELEQEVAADEHSDEELQQAKLNAQKKLIEFRTMLNKKSVLYSELFSYTVTLIDKDDEIIQIEKEAMKLRTEIDVGRLEIKQKQKLADDLQVSLDQKKAIYKQLKADIAELDERSEALEQQIQDIEDELEVHEELHNTRDIELQQLEKLTGEKAPQFNTDQIVEAQQQEEHQTYKAVRGDIVDELLARQINDADCEVPVYRLGNGYYIFGTRKIYAKVNNGRLVVRVGGGFMNFGEFVETSGPGELLKVQELKNEGRWDPEELIAYHKYNKGGPNPTTGRRGSIGSGSDNSMGGSPRGSISGRRASFGQSPLRRNSGYNR